MMMIMCAGDYISQFGGNLEETFEFLNNFEVYYEILELLTLNKIEAHRMSNYIYFSNWWLKVIISFSV
jgi:hypothetical protein